MKFSIDPTIFSLFPEYKVGYLIVQGMSEPNGVLQQEILDLLKQSIKQIQQVSLGDQHFDEWRKAFQKVGIDPQKHKPSHISLIERAKQDGEIPNIYPIVNLLNATSLRSSVPIGTHQLDRLPQGIEIRLTRNGDAFTKMNKIEAESVEEGIPAYCSGHRVLTKNWIWRQGETSKIRKMTQDVLIPIDALSSVSEPQLLEIVKQLKTNIGEFFGGEIITGILSSSNPSVEWDLAQPHSENSSITKVLTRGVAEILPSAESLAEILKKKKIKLYLGIDPTGSLLTLGHSVVLRKLQQFAELGHEVILLIGNGTVRIGDPTGRDSTRPVLTDEQIEDNFKTWKKQASKILDFDKISIRHNGDWLDKLNFAEIVKLMAQTTVQQLIERDMFQKRMKDGLPIFGHEIMYPLLQGYDSVAMDVDLEIGGTDQTFNMMMGRHLQKMYNNHEKWVLTTPIINGTDGRKMSKSYGNYIALTEKPNDMYGKLMSIADSMIAEYFSVLTDEPLQSIEVMKKEMSTGTNPFVFKKKLAFTITQMYHSKADALTAAVHFEKTVQNKEIPNEIPTVKFSDVKLSVIDFLNTCLPKESKSHLRRLIEQSAVEFTLKNREKVKPSDPNEKIAPLNIDVVKVGKRRFFKILTK